MALEHWNNIRGVDRYSGVRCEILVSRPLPSAYELETLAWTLTGIVGTTVPDGLLPVVDDVYLMRDGSGRRAKVRQHPDPVAESVRRAICNDEIRQGEARARAPHRTAETPLEVIIMTHVPLAGVAIDELIRERHLDADATIGRWLLGCGVCPVPGTQGFVPLMATIEGRTEEGVAQGITRDAEAYAELFAFVTASEVPAGWQQYRARPTAEVRYGVPVWLSGEPSAALERVGLRQALVEPMPDPDPDPDEEVTVPTEIWKQAMSQMRGGVLPFSPQWLVDNLLGLFPSVRSAEREIKTAKTSLYGECRQ